MVRLQCSLLNHTNEGAVWQHNRCAHHRLLSNHTVLQAAAAGHELCASDFYSPKYTIEWSRLCSAFSLFLYFLFVAAIAVLCFGRVPVHARRGDDDARSVFCDTTREEDAFIGKTIVSGTFSDSLSPL